ncbi:hypothetical protein B7P43_G13887 [Cryptotermes secundus]|uniref:Uncharacterized protein n=1 Tax=Cryptotermes secundus TaxID=105785 RepID=A0A2J7Q9H4_9NEOP|nr:hypothetical protein B7P43_G13887 [Cryptotermes secundus]
MLHLDTALRKTLMKEKSFRERIHELEEDLNVTLMTLQTSKDYAQQLLGKYEEVTFNIEREMNKHRNLCRSYKNLISEYEKLKAKNEGKAKSGDGREVTGQANEELVEDRSAVTDVEEQMSLLVKSQTELKKKIMVYNEGPPLFGDLNEEMVEGAEVLDGYRKLILDTLERQPHLECEMIEETLATRKRQHVSTASRASP